MMTQPLPSSRKRVRSNNCEEDCCDFMPLSKRINNLHINNASFCMGLGHLLPELEQEIPFGSVPLQETGPESLQHLGYPPASERNDHHHETAGHSHSAWMSSQMIASYSPDLNASDNPYYYESNKLLYALYMERIQRNGNQLY